VTPAAALILAAAALTAPASARDADDLQPHLRALDTLALLDPRRAQRDDIAALSAAINRLERRAERELAEIDADPALYTSPELRQRRSDLAITALTLRLPAARARLAAFDPASSRAERAAAADSLDQLDYAWGDAELERQAALAALRLRQGDHARALAHAARADPSDPAVQPIRVAARAALDTLGDPPRDPALLHHALLGAARSSRGVENASDLAAEALRTADAARIERTRAVALSALANIARERSERTPLVRVALAGTPAELDRIDPSADQLAAAERDLKHWTLDHSNTGALARAALNHPNPAAAITAAEKLTPHLAQLAPSVARPLLARLIDLDPAHPHADHWRLAAGRLGDMDALDAITAPDLAPAAAQAAATLARETFANAPTEVSARELARRARAARVYTSETDPWTAWLLDAETEARTIADNPTNAAEWLLAEPSSDASKQTAAARLLPRALSAALDAERADNRPAQRHAAALAARLAELTSATVPRARALVLANEPGAALNALDGAPGAIAESQPARLARAEALFALRRDAEAFPIYRETAERRGAARDDAYWRAWSRMLAMLARRDAPGDAESIARQLTRLRAQDSDLGGDPHRRRLQTLQN